MSNHSEKLWYNETVFVDDCVCLYIYIYNVKLIFIGLHLNIYINVCWLLNNLICLYYLLFILIYWSVLDVGSQFQLYKNCTKVKLATLVEGDQKVPFSIATTPRCRRGRYSISWIAPLYLWSVPYNAECFICLFLPPDRTWHKVVL